ncbi:hypothetical protein [Roseibium polysiphoniae]|uniref:Uncharacterized protein n=1 Tax=Roseibium polysiphoniae TaxID=2571221 RepID=A0ABR9C668_9HYPH|nr:hypothetical protein [Roseibium polysiphoniae]MBD8875409.1 hypothetical protein [Roseibium polysiphoniae]
MQKENVGFQAFAAEVFKRDPELYEEAMTAAREFVKTRKRHWLDRSRAGELEELNTTGAVVNAMAFLQVSDIQEVQDLSGFSIPGMRLHR